jgi:putative hydrolase of the HAD superfamily
VAVSAEDPAQSRRWRAVIFDLWDTLVAFPWQLIAERDAVLAEALAVDPDELRSAWLRLEPTWETEPLMSSLELLCAELGVSDCDLERLRRVRLEYMCRALQPRREVVETLRQLRQRGLRLGLISSCSGDVPIVWGETPFVGLFDATVFSSEAGLRKPDVRIFRKAASELQTPTSGCLYVGDGGNDELAGAERGGMTAVLLRSSTISAPRESREWAYEIDEIASVLSLV